MSSLKGLAVLKQLNFPIGINKAHLILSHLILSYVMLSYPPALFFTLELHEVKAFVLLETFNSKNEKQDAFKLLNTLCKKFS